MNLIGEQIIHCTLGEGTIVYQERKNNGNDYVGVSLAGSTREFQYPYAFERILTLSDSAKQVLIKSEIPMSPKPSAKPSTSSKPHKELQNKRISHTHHNSEDGNLAIKCTRNDGGSSPEVVGFSGICSRQMIRHNIQKQKHIWCSNPNCSCRQFLDGNLSWDDLETDYRDGRLCYDSRYLIDWTVYGGYVHNGDREGEPIPFKYAAVNKLSVLTTRDPGMSEKERYIFGVFLIQSVDPGNADHSGFADADPKYRLSLSPKQSKKILFWNYYANNNKPTIAKWGSGLHRYLSDEVAAQILQDVTKIKCGTRDEALAQEFLRIYYNNSDLNSKALNKPMGALQIAKNI